MSVGLAAGVSVGGWLIFARDARDYRRDAGEDLTAVGDLQAEETDRWFLDQRRDARLLSADAAIIERLERCIDSGRTGGAPEASLDDAARDYLERIRTASQRMARLIDDMLTLSRVSRCDMVLETVDVSALAEDIVSGLRGDDPGRRVDVRVSPGLEARADLHLLGIALRNVLENAWEFTSRQPEGRIETGITDAGGEKAFFVRDNGAGFDQAYADRLFTPFQRLHAEEEFPGTGIGLATVQRVIRWHAGRVWAAGESGTGATVWFTLGAQRGMDEGAAVDPAR